MEKVSNLKTLQKSRTNLVLHCLKKVLKNTKTPLIKIIAFTIFRAGANHTIQFIV